MQDLLRVLFSYQLQCGVIIVNIIVAGGIFQDIKHIRRSAVNGFDVYFLENEIYSLEKLQEHISFRSALLKSLVALEYSTYQLCGIVFEFHSL